MAENKPARRDCKFKDLTGMKFERLTVLSCCPEKRLKKVLWLCECICGNRKTTHTANLTTGITRSCGCLKKKAKTHGMSGIPEHVTWKAVIKRCEYPSDSDFKYWKGRGIKVCDRWRGKNGFANFYADMGKRPSDKHSIDRIDNNGNYEPGNCRWATKQEQAENRRPWGTC